MARVKAGVEGEVHRFQTWGDFVKACQRPADKSVSSPSSRMNTPSTTWDDNAGWDKALRLAQVGWPEGVRQFGLLTERIQTAVAETVQPHSYRPDDTEGLFFDAGLAMAGEADYWFKREPEYTTGEVVQIVMNATASCGVGADVMIARGAAVAALATTLEMEGRSVEVILAYAVQATERITTLVKVKSFNERAEPSILAYALAHPAAFRRLYFAWQESQKGAASRFNVGHGYGYPTDVDPALMEADALYIGKAYYGDAAWLTVETAAEWVREQLRKYGVEVQD